MELHEAVEIVVALIHADPTVDDDAILRDLADCGVDEATAVRLVQFVPIAFTRFLYRTSGVRFAENYVVLGSTGQSVAERPIAAEPVFREAWQHCETVAAGSPTDGYFESVASRSGGYRAIQDLLDRGLGLAGFLVSPPILLE